MPLDEKRLKKKIGELREKLAEAREEWREMRPRSDSEMLKLEYEAFRGAYRRLYECVSHCGEVLKNSETPNEERVDLGFLFRELENLSDDLRKDCKMRKELAGKILCMEVMTRSSSGGVADDTLHGKLARAECSLMMQPILPKKGSEEYRKLLSYLGVSEDVIENGLLTVHWNHMKEYLTELAERGESIPKEVLDQKPDYRAKFVRKS